MNKENNALVNSKSFSQAHGMQNEVSFTLTQESANAKISQYRDLVVPESFKQENVEFDSRNCYLTDELTDQELGFVAKIIDNRISPFTDNERAFFHLNVFRYYATKAKQKLKILVQQRCLFVALNNLIQEILASNSLNQNPSKSCTLYCEEGLFYHLGEFNYKDFTADATIAKGKQVQLLNDFAFSQKYGFEVYQFDKELNNCVNLGKVLTELKNDTSLLRAELLKQSLFTSSELDEILTSIDAEPLEYPELSLENYYLVLNPAVTWEQIQEVSVKAKQAAEQVFLPIFTLSLCGDNVAGMFVQLPFTKGVYYQQDEYHVYPHKVAQDLSVLSLNYNLLQQKAWGLYTLTLPHELGHWLDWQVQKTNEILYPGLYERTGLEHSAEFFKYSAMLTHLGATERDPEVSQFNDEFTFNEREYNWIEYDEFKDCIVRIPGEVVAKFYNLPCDYYYLTVGGIERLGLKYKLRDVDIRCMRVEEVEKLNFLLLPGDLLFYSKKFTILLSEQLKDIRVRDHSSVGILMYK